MEEAVNGTAEAWQERIGAQRASGRSIRAWCRENGCAEPAFYWWRRRQLLSPEDAGATGRRRGRPAKAIGFAAVVVDGTVSDPIRFCLGSGRELLLPASMSVHSIAKLVHAIEGAA